MIFVWVHELKFAGDRGTGGWFGCQWVVSGGERLPVWRFVGAGAYLTVTKGQKWVATHMFCLKDSIG